MFRKARAKKHNARKLKTVLPYRRGISVKSLRIRYTFFILLGALILAGIALFLRIETPVVWTFLSGIGSWVALTYLLGQNLK
jgi:hypothetical protein